MACGDFHGGTGKTGSPYQFKGVPVFHILTCRLNPEVSGPLRTSASPLSRHGISIQTLVADSVVDSKLYFWALRRGCNSEALLFPGFFGNHICILFIGKQALGMDMDSGLAHAHVTPLREVPCFSRSNNVGLIADFASLAVEWGHPWQFPDLVASLEPGKDC